jgi:hypothetical protein
MRATLSSLALLAAALPALAAGNPFFSGGKAPAGLPKEGAFPKGQQMLFTFYSLEEPQIETAKASGVTALGPYYGDMAKPLSMAHQHGLPFIYSMGLKVEFPKGGYQMPSDQAITNAVKAEMAQVGSDSSILFWNLRCEELRWWKKDDMHWLELTTKAIRQYDPLHRPIYMYEPNGRASSDLQKTYPYLDMVGKSTYVSLAGFDKQRSWVKFSVDQINGGISAARPGATAVVPLQMSADPKDPADDAMVPRWTRHDVFCSLVNGARGVLVWSGAHRKGLERTWQAYFDGYLSAAKQLNGPMDLGRVILWGEKKDDLKLAIASGEKSQFLDSRKGSATEPAVSFLDDAFGGHRYLIIVNSSNAPVKVSISGVPKTGVRMESLFGDDKNPAFANGTITTSLEGLGVAAIKLLPAE